jgi:hypothetical protein
MVYQGLSVYNGSLGLNDTVGGPVEVGNSGHYERIVRLNEDMCRNRGSKKEMRIKIGVEEESDVGVVEWVGGKESQDQLSQGSALRRV